MNAIGALRMAALRRPLTWVLAAVLVAYVVLLVGSAVLLLSIPAEAGLDAELLLAPMRAGGLLYIAQLAGGIMAILIVVFASSLVGAEFAKGTLRTLLLTGVRRGAIVKSMLLFLLQVCALLAMAGVALAALAAAALSATAGEDLTGLQGRGAAVALASLFFRLFVQLAVWGILAFAATLLTRSSLVGIGGTLALQIIGSVAAGLLAALGTPGRWAGRLLVNGAVDRITLPRELDLTWTDLAWISFNLAIYLVLPTWWAMRRFQRMDLVAATRG